MEAKGPKFSGVDIVAATGGSFFRGEIERCCQGVSTDTRTMEADNLFVALHGPRFDGHGFIALALEKGAGGLLVEEGAVKMLQRQSQQQGSIFHNRL